MPHETELKACPFCAKTEHLKIISGDDVWDSESSGNFAVICAAAEGGIATGGCGSCAGYGRTEVEAAAIWNRRPLPAGVGEAGRNSKRPHIPQHLRAERVQGEEETNLRCDGPDDHGGYVFKVTQHGATSDENKELGQELAHRWNAARSALAPLGTTGTIAPTQGENQ